MARKSLSTANSALSITIAGLYPVPQTIEGYATDDAFMADDVQTGEVQMGVDGKLSAGYVPYATPLKITLQADSPSLAIFDNLIAAEKAQNDKFVIGATILLQGNGDKYAFSNGFLTTASPMAGSKKMLQPRSFTIEFQDCSKAPS